MTNDELDMARAHEAQRVYDPNGPVGVIAIAARLAREGWTPPVAVDPDLAEAETLWLDGLVERDLALAGIKRGRELERAETKPGTVWVKHGGSAKCPVALSALVIAKYVPSVRETLVVGFGGGRDWQDITHYAVIAQPEDEA
jgi:hypothetical protein